MSDPQQKQRGKRRYLAVVLRAGAQVVNVESLRQRNSQQPPHLPRHHRANEANEVKAFIHHGSSDEVLEVALIERDNEGLGVTVTSLKDPTVQIEIPLGSIAYAVPYVAPSKAK